MAEEKTGGAPAAPAPVSSEGKDLTPSTPGGSLGIDAFLRKTTGKGIDQINEEEREADSEADEAEYQTQAEARSQNTSTEKEIQREEDEALEEAVEEDEAEDSEEEEEEETEEEQEEEAEEEEKEKEEEPGKKKKAKLVKMIGADGKEIEIPDDVMIEKRIDGKMQKVSLKEVLNITAGEMTVNQRLSKVSSFYEETRKHSEAFQAEKKQIIERDSEILKLVKDGNPDKALAFLADSIGMSPVQLYRNLLANLAKQVQNFEGKTPEQIENHFLTLEADWHRDKEGKRRKAEEAERGYKAFTGKIDDLRKRTGVSEEEFIEARNDLEQSKELPEGDPEKAANAVINQALHTKHLALIEKAVKKVNPKLINDKKLLRLLYNNTDPIKFDENDLAEIIKEVVGDQAKAVASRLSKKAGVKPAQSENKTEAKPKQFSSEQSMREHFGFR